MTFALVVAVIAVGLLLILLEVFFIPGTTLFGVVGGVAVVAGVAMMYAYFGSTSGNLALGVSMLSTVIMLWLGYRMVQSDKLAMKATMDGRVNVPDDHHLQIGDRGEAATDIKPQGKALFSSLRIDVCSNGEYIDKGCALVVVGLANGKVVVKEA